MIGCGLAAPAPAPPPAAAAGWVSTDPDLRDKLGRIFQTVLRKYDIFGRILDDGTCVWEPHDHDKPLADTVVSRQDHLPISLYRGGAGHWDEDPERGAIESKAYTDWEMGIAPDPIPGVLYPQTYAI
jgi:hypothetical protein